MEHVPSVDRWSCAGGALSQAADSLQLYCGFGDMVALFGSKLSVLSCRVLCYGNQTIHVCYKYDTTLLFG